MSPNETYAFSIVKCWQTKNNALVISVNVLNRLPEASRHPERSEGSQDVSSSTQHDVRLKKLFIVLDPDPAKPPVAFLAEKPSDLLSEGTLCNIFRKYLMPGRVIDVKQSPQAKEYAVMVLDRHAAYWMVHLTSSKSPEITIVSPEREVLARATVKASYTKKKPWEGELADDVESVWPSVMEPLISGLSSVRKEGQPAAQTTSQSGPSQDQKTVVKKLKRRLRTLRKALARGEQEIPAAAKIQDLERQGHLLKSFGYAAQRSVEGDFFTLPKDATGLEEDLELPIDPAWSVGEKITETFDLVRKWQKRREFGLRQLAATEREIKLVEQEIFRVGSQEISSEDLSGLYQRHGLKDTSDLAKGQNEQRIPYRTFHSSEGDVILVGKEAKDNDVLTKGAKSNDFWLHAVGARGSHVVISPRRKEEGLPPKVIREAALLALHFSKLREDRAGEVYVTRKMHVKKRKGMAPGLWAVEKAETLYVKYNEAELKAVLGTEPPSR
jgi:hypothetical protein